MKRSLEDSVLADGYMARCDAFPDAMPIFYMQQPPFISAPLAACQIALATSSSFSSSTKAACIASAYFPVEFDIQRSYSLNTTAIIFFLSRTSPKDSKAIHMFCCELSTQTWRKLRNRIGSVSV